MSFIVKRDSISEVPVSDAPTTTIRELFETLTEESIFFVMSESEKGASS
jgi:hypothetical protein